MAFYIVDTKEIKEIRERLAAGKLNDSDIKFLDYLAERAQNISESNVSIGRFRVDQLPVGMDLVK